MPKSTYNHLSSVHIATSIVWLGWFHGISTVVGYSIPNLVNTYLLDIYMICKHFVDNISNKPSSFFARLNGFKYSYPIRVILFTINDLFARS